jgi:hypothetical protein
MWLGMCDGAAGEKVPSAEKNSDNRHWDTCISCSDSMSKPSIYTISKAKSSHCIIPQTLIMSSFSIPPGAAARLSIIDSTSRMHNMPTSMLLSPSVDGFEMFPPLGSWSFLIESSTGTKVLFDLGFPSNVESSPPIVAKQLEEFKVEIKPKRNLADVLRENGVESGEIKSVVWRLVLLDPHRKEDTDTIPPRVL